MKNSCNKISSAIVSAGNKLADQSVDDIEVFRTASDLTFSLTTLIERGAECSDDYELVSTAVCTFAATGNFDKFFPLFKKLLTLAEDDGSRVYRACCQVHTIWALSDPSQREPIKEHFFLEIETRYGANYAAMLISKMEAVNMKFAS